MTKLKVWLPWDPSFTILVRLSWTGFTPLTIYWIDRLSKIGISNDEAKLMKFIKLAYLNYIIGPYYYYK